MRIRLAILAVMLLAGCAAEPPRPQRIAPEIVSAMDQAAQRKPPQTPEQVSEQLLPPLRAEIPKTALAPLEPRFDLVVNNANARDVFNSIVSGTRYSIVISPEVGGTISVNLKDVTVREALDALQEVYGYDYKIDGTRIYIRPPGLRTRVFHVDYLVGLRAGRSDVRVGSGAITGNFTGSSGQGLPPSMTAGLQFGNLAGAVANPALLGAAPGTPGAQQQAQPLSPIGAFALSGLPSDATRISTITQSDFWGEIGNAVRALVGSGEGRHVVISPQSGVIVVRAMPQEIRSVEEYLKAMRLSVDRQVMIEAKIIEVTLNDAYQAGINWSLFSSSRRGNAGLLSPNTTLGTTGTLSTGTGNLPNSGSNLSFNPAGPALATGASTLISGVSGSALLGIAFQTANFAALLQFLQSQGSVQVLSSPRVAAMNNQKAVLKVGTDEFFVTNVTGTPIANAVGVTTNVQLTPTFNSFFSGVSLDITPQIDDDGNILLHIHPLVSSVTEDQKQFNFNPVAGSSPTPIPLAKSTISETDTVVRVQDGNIVALGGLMKVDVNNDLSGVPGAENLPGVGAAFRSHIRSRVKKELVILLRPTVIRSDRDWQQDIEESRERIREMQPPSAPAVPAGAGAR